MEKVDTVVIGAGVIGLAIARACALHGHEVVIAESESMIGSVTSARNSGVIHAGIYYAPESAKARFCAHGRDLLYAYAQERSIPFRRCGKLIVATSAAEIPKLEQIMLAARKNNVHDLRLLARDDAMTMEPEISCHAALLSPSTGIVDVHAFLLCLLADTERAGGFLALQNTVSSAQVTKNGIVLEFNGSSTTRVIASHVVNAAGLAAQAVARAISGIPTETIPNRYLAKGNYFSVSGPAPFSRLIYPVPVAGGLGAHFTMNMAGNSLFGPDVEWLDPARSEDPDYHVDSSRIGTFYNAIRKYWPGIDRRELIPAYAGIRSKITGPGATDSDFAIRTPDDHGIPGLACLYGIESPGLTSSLAIAAYVAQTLYGR